MRLQEKKNILDFVANFSEVAKKEHWISHYDTDTDSISVRTPRLSYDSEKRYLNDEFAFYLNKENKVEGIFIEYFMNNFISHHADIKELKKEIEKEIKAKGGDESAVVQLESKETKKMIPELESALIDSLLPASS